MYMLAVCSRFETAFLLFVLSNCGRSVIHILEELDYYVLRGLKLEIFLMRIDFLFSHLMGIFILFKTVKHKHTCEHKRIGIK